MGFIEDIVIAVNAIDGQRGPGHGRGAPFSSSGRSSTKI